MPKEFLRPASLGPKPFHYCAGCTHGIIHRLVAESIDQLGVEDQCIGVASVGCSVHTLTYFNVDMQQAAHGRAPAVATGIKRVHPGATVFTYQGDGDLAAIGTAEIVHTAARGEKVTVIFVNNAVYGMTGGQMAPTTVVGQKTSTTPLGRNPQHEGYPIPMAEMLAQLPGSAYLARVSVHNPREVQRAGKAITRAFQTQLAGHGFAMVEVLSTCPTNWGLDPVQSLGWLEENMLPVFPLGVFKDWREGVVS